MPGCAAETVRLHDMRDGDGASLPLANVPHMTVLTTLPHKAPPMSILRKKK